MSNTAAEGLPKCGRTDNKESEKKEKRSPAELNIPYKRHADYLR